MVGNVVFSDELELGGSLQTSGDTYFACEESRAQFVASLTRSVGSRVSRAILAMLG